MKQRKLKSIAGVGVAAGLSLLFAAASYASDAASAVDITFGGDAGKGKLVNVKFQNRATVTVDSVVIKQHGHGGCADVERRHKMNLAGKAGAAGAASSFDASLWNGCDYSVKFNTVTACNKGDKDITIKPDDFKSRLLVKLTRNCVDGLKTKFDTY